MLCVPMREGLVQFMGIFSGKMREMGVGIRWTETDTHVEIRSDMGLLNILRPALQYCFENTYAFDHKGFGKVTGKFIRPDLEPNDAILNMYHKWQTRIERRNTF